ncbi:sporulation kinase E [Cupriavidus necator N-1]|uniref:histidine kinase n=1 Tax=Cupriavidus necator (strain ATCC 43291 / DSM 13513 / CCUG 52238 / LMG 8453 / N-1) TaxID=1042878 RepID=F8GNW3_CUPNN|nr:cache domain-containing protein [Cupriavidus necator]AEI80412.1 sporulation kinase E [Cupriavidus necator N-1]MDX6009961.1 cache domain-containing protein [Cupriavidus necator]
MPAVGPASLSPAALLRRYRASLRAKLVSIVVAPLLVALLVLLLIMGLWGNRAFQALLAYKVNSDLLVAHEYFEHMVGGVEDRVLQEARSHALVAGLGRGNAMPAILADARRTHGLDFLQLLDPQGRLLAAAPAGTGADPAAWRIVSSAAAGRAAAATDAWSAAQLAAVSAELARRAQVALRPTANAVPTDKTLETRGMVVHAAAPVFDEAGTLVAILHGGTLLNNNLGFIDTINALVYQPESLPRGSQGTATLFLDDTRIATNVRLFHGERALGTRVSRQVRDKVLLRGEKWLDLAFVVNDWYMSAYEPIADSRGQRIGMLYVGYLAKPISQAKDLALGVLVGLFLLLGVAGALFSLLWARRVFAPMARMVGTMRALKAGNTGARVGPVGSEDELGQLAGQFDQLLSDLQQRNAQLKDWADSLDRKVAERTRELEESNAVLRAARQQLITSEKLAVAGQLTAGVAHEVNNPIAVIQGNLDVAREILGPAAEPVRHELRLIDEQVRRIQQLTNRLLQFVRPEAYAGNMERLDVGELAAGCVDLVRHMLKGASIRVELDCLATRQVRISRSELQQVVVNLLTNAIHAMPEGGTLTLGTRDWEGQGVTLHVRDTGHGIREEDLPNLFNPFFTTKKQMGTGLGLSISYALVERYGGRITVESAVGQGAEFIVWLREDGAAPAQAEAGGGEP